MYFDTPRDYVGDVYERPRSTATSRSAGTSSAREETVRGATRETFLGYLDRWYRPSRMVLGLGGQIGDGRRRAARGAARRHRARRRPASPRRGCCPRTGAVKVCTRSSPTRRTSCSAPAATRSRIPTATRVQLLATVLGGGMSSRLFTEVRERRGLAYYVSRATTATPTRARSTRRRASTSTRIDEAVTTIVGRAAADRRRAGARRRAREGARTSRRAASCSGSRARTGRSCSACGGRCSRAGAVEPTEVLAGLDAVTARRRRSGSPGTSSAASSGSRVIGPFDDARPLRAAARRLSSRGGPSPASEGHTRSGRRSIGPWPRSMSRFSHEGVDLWRPVAARREGELYRLLGSVPESKWGHSLRDLLSGARNASCREGRHWLPSRSSKVQPNFQTDRPLTIYAINAILTT